MAEFTVYRVGDSYDREDFDDRASADERAMHLSKNIGYVWAVYCREDFDDVALAYNGELYEK